MLLTLRVLTRPEPEGMAPGAVLRQTLGAGRHAAPQRSLRGGSGHPEEPAAGERVQTVGGAKEAHPDTHTQPLWAN